MAKKLKKSFKKSSFFLSGPAFTPPPLSGPATSGGTFFLRLPLLFCIIPESFLKSFLSISASGHHVQPGFFLLFELTHETYF